MKNLLSYCSFALLSLWGSKTAAVPQKPEKLKIELGQTFRNDRVKIFAGKKLVFDKAVTTPDSGRVAKIIYISKPRQPFALTVEVNGQKFEQSKPKHETELDKKDYSLLIDYNRETEEVEIKTKIVIVLYD